jgi:hypothetical protein
MSDYWIYTSERRDPIPLTDVTDVRRVKVRLPKGTYRDGDNVTMLGAADIKATGVAGGVIDAMPVYGEGAVTAAIDNAVASVVKYAGAPDEVLHVAPRVKWEVVSGYAFATGSGVIPTASFEPTEDTIGRLGRTLTVTSTLSGLTGNYAVFTGDDLRTGDYIAFIGTVLPSVTGGGTATGRYLVKRITTTAYALYNSSGVLVVLSSTGTSVVAVVEQRAPRRLPSPYLVTVDTTAETFYRTSSSAQSDFVVSGDIVKFSGTTLPTGISGASTYTVLTRGSASADEFHAVNTSTGAVVALSGSPSNVYVELVTPVSFATQDENDIVDLDGLSGVLFFSDEIVSLVSNVDPNA